MYHHNKFEFPSALQIRMLKVVSGQRSCSSILCNFSVQPTPRLNAKIVISIKSDKFLSICHIHRILYIFNHIDKRNETFRFIRLINTYGT